MGFIFVFFLIFKKAIKILIDELLKRANTPEIHLEEFPSVTKYYRNHEFDHEERLDYHFL